MAWRAQISRSVDDYRRLNRRNRAVVAGLMTAGVIIFALIVSWTFRQAYGVYRLTRGVGDTVFLAADGSPWFRMDEQRNDVPLARIAPDLQHAFIAIEDHRFYHHPGVDPIALGRAAFRDLRGSGAAEGGSTLTQQLARTLFLSNERSVGRKIREAVIALMMEATLSKNEILELYLNRIYLSGGVYGVEPMSRKLFGKPAADLNLAESALIAGLARAPSALSPWSNPEGAVARSRLVLVRMRQERFITAEQEQTARRTRIRIRPFTSPANARAGYAKEYLRQLFRNQFGGDHPPDWKVQTTFVPALQDLAERSIVDGLNRFNRPALQAALVVLDPQTGDILALVGGRDFSRSQYNRAIRSKRQPGSAFKPFLFAAALERGYSPVSVLTGLSRLTPQGPDEWSPHNAGNEGPDELTLRAALLESDNRAATLLQQQIGSGPVVRLASSAGLHDLPDVPSLSLGTGVVTPLELTTAFAMFPNGGYAVRPRAIVNVTNADGDEVFAERSQSERVISPQVAYQIVSMLSDVLDRGTAASAREWGVRFPAGGKTGTTDDFKDAWFVGFTTSLVAGVWIGHDQPETIGPDAYAARYALPIWTDFMRRATSRQRPAEEFEVPSGLSPIELCNVSYLRPTEGCPVYTEYFKEGDDIPNRLCPIHPATLRQEVRRTVEGIVEGLGKRLKKVLGF